MPGRNYHGRIVVHSGDCLEVIKNLPDNSIDAIVTDPPYHLASIVKRFGKANIEADDITSARIRGGLDGYARSARGFMGKEWDGGQIAHDPATWAAMLRVLKPGGHLVAFHAPKNWHRMVCAIEDAGFEIRDNIMWMFGTGFPKSHNVSKAIDRLKGAERTVVRGVKPGHEDFANRGNLSSVQSLTNETWGGDGGFGRPWMKDPEKVEAYHHDMAPATEEAAEWDGWGTALKPAYEPIVLARKPVIGSIAENILEYGTGAINIDACRVHTDDAQPVTYTSRRLKPGADQDGDGWKQDDVFFTNTTKAGRWPANVVHDGSDEVVEAFPESNRSSSQQGRPIYKKETGKGHKSTSIGTESREAGSIVAYDRGDSGSAARFFYSAKADKADRVGSKHPTVKPIALMEWLCRMVCPPGGTILDPFAGTGTTGEAAYNEGFNAILIEREDEYLKDIDRRMSLISADRDTKKQVSEKPKPQSKGTLDSYF